MSVLIDKQAAFIALHKRAENVSLKTRIGLLDAVRVIDELPSIEPERKVGKWEYVQYDGNPKIGNWHCSECRLIVNSGFEGTPYYHYCPGCGVKMEVN